jgi:2-polyprenyl-6-methoxyphenol hydroxylase-like FAD-dependent oxidoreductase
MTGNSRVMIIGAGPAGLAVGACLKQADLLCTLLEPNESIKK